MDSRFGWGTIVVRFFLTILVIGLLAGTNSILQNAVAQEPELLASGIEMPATEGTDVAIDDQHVYFSSVAAFGPASGYLGRVPLTGGPIETVATGIGLFDFGANRPANKILLTPTAIVVGYGGYEQYAIERMDYDGSNREVLARPTGGYLLSSIGSDVFFGRSFSSIWRVNMNAPSDTNQVTTGRYWVRNNDQDGNDTYFGEYNTRSVYRIDPSIESTPALVLQRSGAAPEGSVRTNQDFVFFGPRGALFKIAKSDGTTTETQLQDSTALLREVDETHAYYTVGSTELWRISLADDQTTSLVANVDFSGLGGFEVNNGYIYYLQRQTNDATRLDLFRLRLSGQTSLNVAPQQLAFGQVQVSTNSTSQSIQISHADGPPLDLPMAMRAGPQSGDFDVISDTCSLATLANGSSCLIDVIYSPSQIGLGAALLSFDISEPGPIQIPLSGEGIPDPTLQSPSIRRVINRTANRASRSATLAGDKIVIRGRNFGAERGGSIVWFDDGNSRLEVQITNWGDRKIVAIAPAGLSGQVVVSVMTDGGTAANVVETLIYPDQLDVNVSFPADAPIQSMPLDFGGKRVAFFNEINKVASNEVLTGTAQNYNFVIDGASVQDRCFAGAMDAVSVAARQEFVKNSINSLAVGITAAGLGSINTGDLFTDLVYRAALDGTAATLTDEPLDSTLALSIAESLGGYIFAKATSEFVAGSTLFVANLSKGSVKSVLRDEGIASWSMQANNSRSGNVTAVGVTGINSRFYYNPFNRRLVGLIDAECSEEQPSSRYYAIIVTVEEDAFSLNTPVLLENSIIRRRLR